MTETGTDGKAMVLTPLLPPAKPRLRGWFHQIAFLASIPLGLALVAVADTTAAKVAALVYSLGASALYGTSAAYHRGHWSPRGRAWMKRLDHSMIFVLIAATYTPICVLGLRGSGATLTLVGVWAGATLGVVLGMAGIAEKNGVGMTLYLSHRRRGRRLHRGRRHPGHQLAQPPPRHLRLPRGLAHLHPGRRRLLRRRGVGPRARRRLIPRLV